MPDCCLAPSPYGRYVLMAREVVLWDLAIGAAMASVRLDRTDHDLTAMAQTLAQPTTLLCMHHDGCLSCWERKAAPSPKPAAATSAPAAAPAAALAAALAPATDGTTASGALPPSPVADVRVAFAFRSMVPLLKGGGSSLLCFAASHPDGMRFGGVSADGRVWLWALPPAPAAPTTGALGGGVPSGGGGGGGGVGGGSALGHGGEGGGGGVQLVQCGLLSAVGSSIASMAMQPPIATSASAAPSYGHMPALTQATLSHTNTCTCTLLIDGVALCVTQVR
jgi:hypothetical protein